jgi:hypothetical protein
MSTLTEIERATADLPLQQQERLFEWLAGRLQRQLADKPIGHSVVDIAPVSLGRVLQNLGPGDDLLDEMLEYRR